MDGESVSQIIEMFCALNQRLESKAVLYGFKGPPLNVYTCNHRQ